MKATAEESEWATEQLQVIRTLMERSALYRRTLAPVMLFLGILGITAAYAGDKLRHQHFDIMPRFGELWLCTAIAAVAGAFLITRWQALKANESFWSPPLRCVAQAAFPPMLAGLLAGLAITFLGTGNINRLVFLWILLYGCAMHAAGFYVPRGMRLFGWMYIIAACLLLALFNAAPAVAEQNMHWFMGFFFGVLQLAYGIYLFFTEKGSNAA